MSKQSRPTSEELKFVYDLILEGYDDSDILAEYAQLHDAGRLMFPWRTDKRFIRERRKELISAQEVLKEHMKQKVASTSVENKKQHFQHLAEIAELLLDGGLDKIDAKVNAAAYVIMREDEVFETMPHAKLVATLEYNLDLARQKYTSWDVFDCLMKHIEDEYPNLKDPYVFINENPIDFINMMRTIARRKTFKGTCPVCKDW